MGHSQTSGSDYVRPTTFALSNVVEDSDLVDGNVELWLDYANGPIWPFVGYAAGTTLAGRRVGIGAFTWGTSAFTLDNDGAFYATSASGITALAPGQNYQTNAKIDLTFTVKVGTIGAGMAWRYSGTNSGFFIWLSVAAGRIKADVRLGSSTDINLLTGTTPVVSGGTYEVRFTCADDVWNVWLDGVLQGTFTDASWNFGAFVRMNWAIISRDTTSRISNIEGTPTAACPATTYEVVNDAGQIVLSGPVPDGRLLLPDASLVQGNDLGPYGGYKVRLYGADVGYYATAKGDCQFVRVKPADGFGPKPGAFTPHLHGVTGWELALRCFFGLGPTRLEYDDGDVEAAAQYLQDNYVAHAYPSRPRHVIGHFAELNPDSTSTMTATVNALKHVIDAWEPLNEPNFSNYTGSTWVAKQQAFYNAIKAADPDALVLGANLVAYTQSPGTGGTSMQWHQAFFAGGGADYLDGGYSVHGYNGTNGDIPLSRRQLELLSETVEPYGLDLWQTEQSHHSQYGYLCMPRHALTWTAVQLMVQETRGIPIERNVLWYDVAHGFNYTSFWWVYTGVTSVPVLVRTMVAELGDRTFDSEYDLGVMQDFYVAAKWTGTDGTTTAGFLAQSVGQPDLRFYLTGSDTVECCDAFGNEFTLTRGAHNIVSVPVDDLPTWVRLPVGVELTELRDLAYGTNLALNGTVTAPLATSVANPANLVSEILENQYDRGGGGPAVGEGYNFSAYTGATQQESAYPQTVIVQLATPAAVSKIVIASTPIWQTWFGTPTDFDVDISTDGAGWTTIHTVTPPASTTATFVSDFLGNNSTIDTWFDPPTVWVIDAPGTVISHIRLYVRDASWGGHETAVSSQAVWGAAWNPLTVRGLRLYDADTFDATERQRFNLTVTVG